MIMIFKISQVDRSVHGRLGEHRERIQYRRKENKRKEKGGNKEKEKRKMSLLLTPVHTF